jgi:MoaA/NifB/PqqE/SkfB family radical SAM enzyme
MLKAVELCWQITSKCNERCKFCHFFTEKFQELSFNENKIILENIHHQNIPSITWSGGEALLYNELDELLRLSKLFNIKNTIITNGQTYNENSFQYIDELVVSIDSIDTEINQRIGRGRAHFKNAINTLDRVKRTYPNLEIRINTVLNSLNINSIDEIYNNIVGPYNIKRWRLSKFTPLRGRARENMFIFNISDQEFAKIITKIKNTFQIDIETREMIDFEQLYILIIPNGDIVVTHNGEDKILGNAQYIEHLDRIIGKIWTI